jgi:hypothetical protein
MNELGYEDRGKQSNGETNMVIRPVTGTSGAACESFYGPTV